MSQSPIIAESLAHRCWDWHLRKCRREEPSSTTALNTPSRAAPGRKSFGLALASGTQPPTAPSVCPSVPWAPAKPCPRCSQNILEAHIPPRLCPSFQPGWPAPFALLDKGLPHSVMQQEGPLLVQPPQAVPAQQALSEDTTQGAIVPWGWKKKFIEHTA